MTGSTESRGKRKAEDKSGDVARKKKLNDAFKVCYTATRLTQGLSITQNGPIGQHIQNDKDTQMREPSSYDRDAHTVVVNSLEDESDVEIEEPKFIINFPGPIDKTYAGKGIPGLDLEQFVNRANAANSQLVLYQGKPEEIIGRSLQSRAVDADADSMELD